ncbi:MAG TPA: hypothetical protein VJ044_04745, partial [Candidatus Hodarchaeales archaeon]|nr:hypothetical protein [Candidatus Hodarchaeales archaeon]
VHSTFIIPHVPELNYYSLWHTSQISGTFQSVQTHQMRVFELWLDQFTSDEISQHEREFFLTKMSRNAEKILIGHPFVITAIWLGEIQEDGIVSVDEISTTS